MNRTVNSNIKETFRTIEQVHVQISLKGILDTPRKVINEKLSIPKLGSSSVLIKHGRRSGLTNRKLSNSKFTWCFHKSKQTMLFFVQTNLQKTDQARLPFSREYIEETDVIQYVRRSALNMTTNLNTARERIERLRLYRIVENDIFVVARQRLTGVPILV